MTPTPAFQPVVRFAAWLFFALALLCTPLQAYAQDAAADAEAAAACAADTEAPTIDGEKQKTKIQISGVQKQATIKIQFTEHVDGFEAGDLRIVDYDSGEELDAEVVEVREKTDGLYIAALKGIHPEEHYRLIFVDQGEPITDSCGNAFAAGDDPNEVEIIMGYGWLKQLAPLGILLAIVGLVLWRLPKVEIDHSDAFRRRRFFNWFPLGLTYAFLYMGRYNLTVSKNFFAEEGLMTNADFGNIFAIGAVTYGVAFMINGPLCDRLGGRKTMLIGATGAAVMNLLMGLVVILEYTENLFVLFSILFAANMYFQSFGAVSIVKVNAGWFHVRERGILGGVFGILISLGVFFAYDLNRMIASVTAVEAVFFVPAVMLAIFIVIDYFVVRDRPKDAGYENFDLGDGSTDDDEGERLPVLVLFKKMITNPVIFTIIIIEFCSGFLRNAIMQWGMIFAKQTGAAFEFVFSNWGLMLACAGITAGMFAGVISDYVFNSRRGPVAAILYGGMLLGSIVLLFLLGSPMLGWMVIFMSLCIIGVHGMLSGTASMDFGGRANAGVAVGIIDAAVYLGTGFQSVLLGWLLPDGPEARDPANWIYWPIVMIPLAAIGFLMALRIWNAKPQKRTATGK